MGVNQGRLLAQDPDTGAELWLMAGGYVLRAKGAETVLWPSTVPEERVMAIAVTKWGMVPAEAQDSDTGEQAS